MSDKRCSGCKQELSVDHFYHDYGRADTYYPYCKVCASQRSRKRLEKYRAQIYAVQQQWRANNRERINTYQRLWRRRKAMKENGL